MDAPTMVMVYLSAIAGLQVWTLKEVYRFKASITHTETELHTVQRVVEDHETRLRKMEHNV